jgi:serine phosphatase RsbU (regulator of sigma subunit)
MSDGIVEAQDADGNLFGFERISELLQRHASANEIADLAQNFGQEDDILVLQVQRRGDTQLKIADPARHDEVPA